MYSREEVLAELTSDAERIQYDEGDLDRIKAFAGTFTHQAVQLIESLGEYTKETLTEVDEDSTSRMTYARRDVVEKWAAAQIALSKIAFGMRIDGSTAYERLTVALKTEDRAIDMSGL